VKPTKKAAEMTRRELAAYIDQSVLKPDFTQGEIKKYIQEGIDYECKTVCVNPSAADMALTMTDGTFTKVCVVCDFPFGLSETASKCRQAEAICKKGIFELDVVANYGWMKSGMWEAAEADIRAVNDLCAAYNVALKVILETDALTPEEIIKGTRIVADSGAAFVKTSTGFYTGGKNDGATVEVIRMMTEAAGGRCLIKGSGGIRTREHFLALIDMGIDRMGVGFKSTPVILGFFCN
jgi:deoxyribose-phosphate aldolase